MNVTTSRFGDIEIPEDRIVFFPEGVPGFKSKRFAILTVETNPMIEWLQSLDEPDVAMMMIAPLDLLLEYEPRPKPGDIRPVVPEGCEGDEIIYRIIIRNGDNPGELYLNLFAPVLLNVPRKLGMQVPLVGSGFSVREVWPPRP